MLQYAKYCSNACNRRLIVETIKDKLKELDGARRASQVRRRRVRIRRSSLSILRRSGTAPGLDEFVSRAQNGIIRGNAAHSLRLKGTRMAISLKVNGEVRSVNAEPDTPLLYVLRNDFELNGAKFGCGLSQCGACAVLINGAAVRSCVMAIANLGQNEITTLEGLGTLDKLHPLQTAFIDEQAAQCGYCANGMIIAAADLLKRNPQPTEAQVREGLAGHLCRCGTHNRIVRAVMRAAQANGRT
jgi:nicotinate dehydrogenase subunit A